MITRITFWLLSFCLLLVINSCCVNSKNIELGNNIYLSEYDNVDRRIVYQSNKCANSGKEIVPMTVLEIAYNNEWIIAKSGNKKKQTDFKYWVLQNKYKNLPNSKTVTQNTIGFTDYKLFKSFLINNKIDLKLTVIE